MTVSDPYSSDPFSNRAERPRQAPGQDALNLRWILSILRRRKILVAGVMFVITATATVLVFQITPRYRATAKIVVQPTRYNIVDIEAVASGLTTDYYTNETEAALISSRLRETVVSSIKTFFLGLIDPRTTSRRSPRKGRGRRARPIR